MLKEVTKINKLDKALNNIRTIFQQYQYILSNLERERYELKTILNNESEYERLSNLVKSECNIYDTETEIYMLIDLNRILLKGIKSEEIKSIQQIQKLSLIIDNI